MFGIFFGKEKSAFNIIIDENADQSLKYGIIDSLGKSEKDVIVFCYQESKQSYMRRYPSSSKLVFINEFDDPLSWVDKDNSQLMISDLKSQISQCGYTHFDGCVIFIDDVNLFGRSRGLIDSNGDWKNESLKKLIQLSKDIPMFIYVKPALMNAGILKALDYHSSCSIKFVPPNAFLQKPGKYECVYRKKSGKVIAEAFHYTMDSNGTLIFTKNQLQEKPSAINEGTDPSSNLTFNLRLTASEQDARAKTNLPYILKDESKATMLRYDVNKNGKGGDIIYTPDDFDDFDDEDPDDDLDI